MFLNSEYLRYKQNMERMRAKVMERYLPFKIMRLFILYKMHEKRNRKLHTAVTCRCRYYYTRSRRHRHTHTTGIIFYSDLPDVHFSSFVRGTWCQMVHAWPMLVHKCYTIANPWIHYYIFPLIKMFGMAWMMKMSYVFMCVIISDWSDELHLWESLLHVNKG